MKLASRIISLYLAFAFLLFTLGMGIFAYFSFKYVSFEEFTLLLAVLLVMNLAMAIVLLLLVRWKISRPLRDFARQLQLDTKDNEMPRKLDISSPYTELNVLGTTINNLLEVIREKQQDVAEQKNLFMAVFEQSPTGITYGDADGNIYAANSRFCEITGWEKSELAAMNWQDITHPDDLDRDKQLFTRFLAGEIPGFSLDKRYLKKDGSYVWTQITVAPLNIPSNPDVTNVCMIEDISERLRMQTELRESEHSKDVLLQNMQGLAYRSRYDRNWTMLYVSYGCRELTGWEPESLINNRDIAYNDLISPGYRQIIRQQWNQVLPRREPFRMEYPIVTRDGIMKWVLEQGTGIYDDQGRVQYLEGLIVDVTDRKLHELEIEFLNQHDVLTGLYNRRFFEQELGRLELEKIVPLSILIGDINGLKLINDAFGMASGDKVIRDAAEIIRENSRQADIISRTGGDEFIILMPDTDENSAYGQMLILKDRFTSYNSKVDDEALRINISFGFATRKLAAESLVSILNQAEDYMRKHKILEKRSSQSSILASIQVTMYERSQETEAHAQRMADLAYRLGQKLNLAQIELDKLVLLAKLHDIGKIGIDSGILNKPGKLTAEEWAEMKKHPEIGYRIAANSPELIAVADSILSHHERWDGNGYPQGLKGEEIPLLARILAIVDAYDAMTEDRSYRKAISGEAALAEIEVCAGSQFDPHIAGIFISMLKKPEGE